MHCAPTPRIVCQHRAYTCQQQVSTLCVHANMGVPVPPALLRAYATTPARRWARRDGTHTDTVMP